LFFALNLRWSWLLWILVALSDLPMDIFPKSILLAEGGFSPVLVARVLTLLNRGRKGRQDYYQHDFNIMCIGTNWYGVILFTVPLIPAQKRLLDVIVEGKVGELEVPQVQNIRALRLFCAYSQNFFIQAQEEIGWQGYAPDNL